VLGLARDRRRSGRPRAALIEGDLDPGDGRLKEDTDTGLEWLDVTAVEGSDRFAALSGASAAAASDSAASPSSSATIALMRG